MLFVIFLLILIIDSILIVIFRQKKKECKSVLDFIAIIYVSALFFIPFFDILKIPGFLASFIMEDIDPSINGFIIGIIVINCGIYGIHIFLSSVNLLKAERYKHSLITTGQFAKRRFPIIASCHLIGLSYVILMGSITGVATLSVMMIFLFFDTLKIEKEELIPNFGDKYLKYQKTVPKRVYSTELLIIFILEYSLFALGILGSYISI
jgi:protein-S-isoprenylcysteine O-methyltransferase Ste14